jgi:hypothetical protein
MRRYDLEKYIDRIIGPCEVTEENKRKAARRIFELCREHERYTKVARILGVPPKCVRQVMSLWKELETTNDSAINTHLSHSDARTSITFKEDSDTARLLQERKPQQILAKQAEKRRFVAKESYDRLKKLESVGKEMSITRERARQLLVRGFQRGLLSEVPSSGEAKFKKLCDMIPRQKLIDALFRWGSIRDTLSELANIVTIDNKRLKKLAKFYEIDVDFIVSAGRKNKVVQRYYLAVSQLGFHPTETMLCKMQAYKGLSAQIRRWWGSFDNFRKEYNVPIPPKGSPLFRQGNPEFRNFRAEQNERRKQEQRQRIDHLFSYIAGKNGLLTIEQITKDLHLRRTTLHDYLTILLKENKIYKTNIGRRFYYSINAPRVNASSSYA